MSQLKFEFIESLQVESKTLSPYEISQLIRLRFSWLCLYRADPDLDPATLRGYMVRQQSEGPHTPDNPAGFWCVIAGKQSMGWQNLVWTKEMLQALDAGKASTTDGGKLGEVLDMEEFHAPNHDETPPHIVADKNGFTLALGCAVPRALREKLRLELKDSSSLDPLVRAALETNIPSEYVDQVLSADFESRFDTALAEIHK